MFLIFTYNLSSRFRELKEEENRRKLNKALAAGDSNALASTYDSEDEESDDETTEEVLRTLDLFSDAYISFYARTL